jgi:peptidoglycan hydrolase-like protein with peptidoglycan-binding domain
MAIPGHGQLRGGCGGLKRMTIRRVLALLVALSGLAVVAPAAPAAPQPSVEKAACQRTLASYPILHLGDRGRGVRTLQCSLNDLDLGPVVVDGYYGRQTRRAVWQIVKNFEGGPPEHPFRINNGMWTLLFGCQLTDHQLAEGDHGHAVVVLQRALRAAGGSIVVDGDFGPQTTAVVKQYQRAQGNTPTGRVEESTRFILCMGGVIGQLD